VHVLPPPALLWLQRTSDDDDRDRDHRRRHYPSQRQQRRPCLWKLAWKRRYLADDLGRAFQQYQTRS
jgi:hypothetical protein